MFNTSAKCEVISDKSKKQQKSHLNKIFSVYIKKYYDYVIYIFLLNYVFHIYIRVCVCTRALLLNAEYIIRSIK